MLAEHWENVPQDDKSEILFIWPWEVVKQIDPDYYFEKVEFEDLESFDSS